MTKKIKIITATIAATFISGVIVTNAISNPSTKNSFGCGQGIQMQSYSISRSAENTPIATIEIRKNADTPDGYKIIKFQFDKTAKQATVTGALTDTEKSDILSYIDDKNVKVTFQQ